MIETSQLTTEELKVKLSDKILLAVVVTVIAIALIITTIRESHADTTQQLNQADSARAVCSSINRSEYGHECSYNASLALIYIDLHQPSEGGLENYYHAKLTCGFAADYAAGFSHLTLADGERRWGIIVDSAQWDSDEGYLCFIGGEQQ